MVVVYIALGAFLLYMLQTWLYRNYWNRGLEAWAVFDNHTAVQGDICTLCEVVENRKVLPLPVLKVKFQVSRNLRFLDEGEGAVTDLHYRNDIMTLMPWQRVTRELKFCCTARGYYRITGVDLVGADLFLTQEGTVRQERESALYVYPRPVKGRELDSALQKMSGDVLVKRHMLEDPFEYRGIRSYAPFDGMKAVNWKATARTGDLMVNMKNYTAMQAVRIFLNVDDSPINRHEKLVELCISIAVRLAQDMLSQGIRTALYANGRDILTGEPVILPAGNGAAHIESLNRSLARMDLDQPALLFSTVFAKQLSEDNRSDVTFFLSCDMGQDFRGVMHRYAESGREFTWLCPLLPGMDCPAEDWGDVHLVRLNAEELLDEADTD